jgi:hypothetical protein
VLAGLVCLLWLELDEYKDSVAAVIKRHAEEIKDSLTNLRSKLEEASAHTSEEVAKTKRNTYYLTAEVTRSWKCEELEIEGKQVSIHYQLHKKHFYLKVHERIAKISVSSAMALDHPVCLSQNEDFITKKSRTWMGKSELMIYLDALLHDEKILTSKTEGAHLCLRSEWVALLRRVHIHLQQFPQNKWIVMDDNEQIQVCLKSKGDTHFLLVSSEKDRSNHDDDETEVKFLVTSSGHLLELDEDYDFQSDKACDMLIYLFSQSSETSHFWSLEINTEKEVKLETTPQNGKVETNNERLISTSDESDESASGKRLGFGEKNKLVQTDGLTAE